MISKILKISGVGKFKNFTNGGNECLRFLKRTIIFGYNTYGKSTLTTIFRSLRYSDKKYIEGKKSFGHTNSIAIDILDSNGEHLTLSNGKWNNSNIVIFDNYFINNFVFIGDEIDHKHKSSLHGIFVGENVIQKVIKLKELRVEQNNLEKLRDQVKNTYIKNDLGAFDVFLKAKPIEGVIENIERKKDEIKRLKNIVSLKHLVSNSPLANKFEQFYIAMQKTLDISVEKNINDHIDAHWKNALASKNFLADGIALLKDEAKECVFCGQDLSHVTALVDAYKKVFGTTYKETRQEIEKIGEAFLRLDLEVEISKFTSLGVNCVDILDQSTLLESKKLLDEDVRKKLKDLNHDVDCKSDDKPFKRFINEITKLHPFLEELKKCKFSSEEQERLENEMKLLELSQYRYSSEGRELAKKYGIMVATVETKKTEVDDLRREIVEETKNAIEKSQEQVNIILKDVLKADFTIQKLNSRSNLTRSDAYFIEYEFVIDGTIIPLSNKHSQTDEEPLDKPYFGNTLSDSDRRLLAMAFFISGLQTSTDLKNKIVILDDPFSSFDSNRKDYLARAIINIQNAMGEQPEQVIILTHDDGFLGRLQDKLPNADTKILKIKYSDANGSVLDTCDVDELIEEQFFKDIKYIKDSIDNSRNIYESLGKVRKCLERVLRHKYYFSLDKDILRDGSISSYLEKIGSKCLVKDEILKGNWHEHMHDQKEIMKLSDPEKIQKLKDFLKLLERV